jgi:hypothetical protein
MTREQLRDLIEKTRAPWWKHAIRQSLWFWFPFGIAWGAGLEVVTAARVAVAPYLCAWGAAFVFALVYWAVLGLLVDRTEEASDAELEVPDE